MSEVDSKLPKDTMGDAKHDVESSEAEDTEGKHSQPMATIGEVFSFAESPRTKAYLALGVFFAMISGLIMPAFMFYFTRIMGSISTLGEEGIDPILEIVYALMVLGVLSMLSESLHSGFLETAATDMTSNLQRHWFRAVVRQDMAYFDLQDVSGTATTISTNAAKYRKGISQKLGAGAQFSCTVIAGFGLAFYSSWRVALAVLTIVPIMALNAGWLLKLNQTKSARDNAAYSKAGSIVYQAAANIRTVLALNAGEELIERFEKATSEAYAGAISQLLYTGLANGALFSSFNMACIVVVGYGSWLLYSAVEDTGCDPSDGITNNVTCDPQGSDIFLALMGIIFGGASLPQISASLEAITDSRAACFPALLAMSRRSETGDEVVDLEITQRSEAMQRRAPGIDIPKYQIDVSSPFGMKPKEVVGTIEFMNVSFSYPTRSKTPVFDGFNLKIEAGKTVALVGPSGSGKSTSIQLIERFYDPTFGTVTLDGVDLKELNVSWLRGHIGLVSQEPALFAGTIKANIRIARPGATDKEVEEAARRANAHDFILSLEQGYDTNVGDRGSQLSGGQKQRIAIARTLITNPKIILLDEATSALDSESEAIVQEALDVVMGEGNVTVVVIAHRLSTIKNADVIAVVDSGRVAESGNHEELMARRGKYFDLVEAQKGRVSRSSSSVSLPSSVPGSESDFESNYTNEVDFITAGGGGAGLVPEESVEESKWDVIDAHNIHFTYPSRPDHKVCRGLEFSVQKGETLAFVGPSGQGKSTIIQLIEEFYRPKMGMIRYNGDDVSDLNVRWYRNEIGLVSQEPSLFDGTIAENIKFGFPRATQDDIEEAAKKANAHDFILSFPGGYNTSVGIASSSQISGGQKQRIAIARALLRKPKVLLLDEATSALDTESEKVVQEAVDRIMADKKLITIVIAHRLSTIRGADKIAYVDHGKVREVGTYEELMAKPGGLYKRLETLQSMDQGLDRKSIVEAQKLYQAADANDEAKTKNDSHGTEGKEVSKAPSTDFRKKAKDIAKEEYNYFFVGSIGALMQGVVFPGQGFVFAYLIEVFYQYTLPCEDEISVPFDFLTCEDYRKSVADDMQELANKTIYLLVGLILFNMTGATLMFVSFGTATERINKRVRDKTFRALIRQEVAWYDVRSVGQITSQLSDDAAMIHSFSGEPIRTMVLAIASVGAGLIVSFSFMWEFAFVAVGILPFIAFGRYMQNERMRGKDEGDIEKMAANSSEGAIVVETLVNIRIIASLSLEEERVGAYSNALASKNNVGLFHNIISGTAHGLGTFFQMWGYALMFYFGSWLMLNRGYEMREYLISQFSIMLSLTGLASAMSGLTDAEEARAAAGRIFELMDRTSEIDPLSDEGKVPGNSVEAN